MILSRRRVMGGALSCFALPVAAAQPSAAKGWLNRWLAAFNDPHVSRYASFVAANIPSLVPYLDEDLAVREASGGVALLRQEKTAPGEITAWLRDRNWDRFSKVILTIGKKGIEDVSFAGAPIPPGFAIARSSEGAALAAFRQKLRSETTAGRFSGTVLVAKDGDVLLREAYGATGAEKAQAVTPETRFCIGSMGKMFTAVGIHQLLQAHKLHLTDTIASLLPDYPDTVLARTVTVEHLLSHTGGTGDFFGPDYEKHILELHTPSDFIRIFGRREVLFPPGSRWGYSNFGFILLGTILEKISGERWDTYLEQKVFRIAGMTATSPIASAKDTAMPLTGAAQTGLKPLPYYTGLPAGGGYATIDDLHRFATALKTCALLDAEHLTLLTAARTPAGNAQWSLGLRVAIRNGAVCFGHGGNAPGVNADFAVYPRSGYTVIVLCNRGHPHAVNAAEFIGTRLPDGAG